MIWQLNEKICNKEINGVISAYKTPSIFPAVLLDPDTSAAHEVSPNESTMNLYQTLSTMRKMNNIHCNIGSNIFVGLKKKRPFIMQGFIIPVEV